jgi:hypothetical protein
MLRNYETKHEGRRSLLTMRFLGAWKVGLDDNEPGTYADQIRIQHFTPFAFVNVSVLLLILRA